MDEGRRQFLKKMGLMGLVLLTPVLFLSYAFRAPTDDVEAFKKFYGLDELGGSDDLAQLDAEGEDGGELEPDLA